MEYDTELSDWALVCEPDYINIRFQISNCSTLEKLIQFLKEPAS